MNRDAKYTYEDAYRAGYEAGYFYGRLDEMKGASYDARTPGVRFAAKENEKEAVE